jgi:hypothetical protein
VLLKSFIKTWELSGITYNKTNSSKVIINTKISLDLVIIDMILCYYEGEWEVNFGGGGRNLATLYVLPFPIIRVNICLNIKEFTFLRHTHRIGFILSLF